MTDESKTNQTGSGDAEPGTGDRSTTPTGTVASSGDITERGTETDTDTDSLIDRALLGTLKATLAVVTIVTLTSGGAVAQGAFDLCEVDQFERVLSVGMQAVFSIGVLGGFGLLVYEAGYGKLAVSQENKKRIKERKREITVGILVLLLGGPILSQFLGAIGLFSACSDALIPWVTDTGGGGGGGGGTPTPAPTSTEGAISLLVGIISVRRARNE